MWFKLRAARGRGRSMAARAPRSLAVSGLLQDLQAQKRSLQAAQAGLDEEAFRQRSELQLAPLLRELERIQLTAEDAADIAEKMLDMPWDSSLTRRVLNALGARTTQPAGDHQALQPGRTQVFIHLENWLTEERWGSFLNTEITPALVESWARACAELGARCCSESSAASSLSVFLMAALGSQEALAMENSHKLSTLHDFKARLKRLPQEIARICSYATYPDYPQELGAVTLAKLYGPDGAPKLCPLPMQYLRVVKQSMPMRRTK